MKKLIAIFLLCFSVPSFATLNGTGQWNVTTTGNDSNGGAYDPSVASPGTDGSIIAAVPFSDLIIGATTTQATSVTLAFSATTNGPGNFIHITGGTGCTTGWFEEFSQAAGTATFDRSLGTAASVCTGILGGALLTISQAITNSAVDNMTVWVKAGTYTITTALAPTPSQYFRGYTTTKGDISGMDCSAVSCPTVTTATNSTNLFNLASNKIYSFYNFNMTNTAATRAIAIKCNGSNQTLFADHLIIDGTTQAMDSGGNCASVTLHSLEVKNNSPANKSVINCSNDCALSDSYLHDNTLASGTGYVYGNSSNNATTLLRNTFYNNTFSGFGIVNASSQRGVISNNNFVSNSTTNVLTIGGGTDGTVVENNVFYNNTATAISYTAIPGNVLFMNNAFGSNTADGTTGIGAITGISDPFVAKASGNFALNTTAGAGALLRGAGFPGLFPGGATTGYISIGAAQPSTSAGSASGVQTTVQN